MKLLLGLFAAFAVSTSAQAAPLIQLSETPDATRVMDLGSIASGAETTTASVYLIYKKPTLVSGVLAAFVEMHYELRCRSSSLRMQSYDVYGIEGKHLGQAKTPTDWAATPQNSNGYAIGLIACRMRQPTPDMFLGEEMPGDVQKDFATTGIKHVHLLP